MREKPFNLDKFKDYTIDEVYKYIKGSKHKYAYLFDIFSYKFDEVYNTPEARRAVFEGLDLASLSEFANTYHSIEFGLDPILEEVWIHKSLEQYGQVIRSTEEILSNSDVRSSSIDYLEELFDSNHISKEQFEICKRMAQIKHTLLSANMLYINFESMDECDNVIRLLDHVHKCSDGVGVPKILRLPDEQIIKLVDNYITLEELLDGLNVK